MNYSVFPNIPKSNPLTAKFLCDPKNIADLAMTIKMAFLKILDDQRKGKLSGLK